MSEPEAESPEVRGTPPAKRTLWLGAAFGAATGLAAVAWGVLEARSVAYLPLFAVFEGLIGVVIGVATALFGLVAWDLTPERRHRLVGPAVAVAGTVLWFLWSVIDSAGELRFVWPRTGIAAVLMSGFALVLVTSARSVQAKP